jgi:hypothetical protein
VINDSIHGGFHPLKSYVGGLLVLCEQLSQRLYHGSSSSPAGGGGSGGGCISFGVTVNGK